MNGRSIQDYRMKDGERLWGYVPQEQILFAMSIKDNIRFEIQRFRRSSRRATKICGLYDDIMAMPVDLIRYWRKGCLLSGGQKTTSIDGTCACCESGNLMLDDSLSAVDAKTEHLILENLKRERSDKTTMITAHRLSAIVHAAYHRFRDDVIVEKKRHEELMASVIGMLKLTTVNSLKQTL